MLAKKEINLENIIIAPVDRTDNFAQRVANNLGLNKNIFSIMNPIVFSGREFCPTFKEDITGKHVYIIAPNNPWEMGPQGKTKRIEIVADAAKSNWADFVTACVVDISYGRQERFFSGQARSFRAQAKAFKTSGIDRIMTVHAHNEKAYNAFGEIYFEEEINSELSNLLWDYPKITEIIEKNKRNKSPVDFIDLMRPGKTKAEKNSDGEETIISEKKEFFDINNKELLQKIKEFYERYDAITRRFGKKVFHNLDPSPILAHYLLTKSVISNQIENQGENIVIVYSDKGVRSFGENLRKNLFLPNTGYIQIEKIREEPNREDKLSAEYIPELSNFGESIQDKWLIIPDDGMETGGTLRKANHVLTKGEFAEKYGNPKGVIIYFTHPWLNGKGYIQPQERLSDINPAEIITTNTNSNIESKTISEFKSKTAILKLEKYIANAIYCLESGKSPEEEIGFNSREELNQARNLYIIKKEEF